MSNFKEAVEAKMQEIEVMVNAIKAGLETLQYYSTGDKKRKKCYLPFLEGTEISISCTYNRGTVTTYVNVVKRQNKDGYSTTSAWPLSQAWMKEDVPYKRFSQKKFLEYVPDSGKLLACIFKTVENNKNNSFD